MSRLAVIAVLMLLGLAAGYAGFRYQQSLPAGPVAEPPPDSSPRTLSLAELNSRENSSMQGSLRPEFSLPDVSGRLRHVNEWDGRVVALNFWATWCQPCLREIPAFVTLQKRYADQGLQFVGIAMQRPEEVLAFIAEQEVNYPMLAGELEVARLVREYGNDIGALPYTVIIDRNGRIAFIKYGELSGSLAEHIISVLL